MSDFLQKLHDMPDKTFKEELAEASAAYENADPAPAPVEKPVEAAPPAPAVVEPVAEETAPEAPEAPLAPVQQPERQVPLKALQEERQKRAELERRLAMLEQRVQQPPQPEAEPEEPEDIPDPETDPIGSLKWMRQQQEELRQQRAQEQHLQHVQHVTTLGEAEFAKTVPDYYDAVSFLQNARAQELRVMHPGAADFQIAQAVISEARQLADMALKQRVNPATQFYQLAKARGFGGKAPAPAAEPVAEAPAAPAINAELQAVKQQVASSVAAGGKGPSKQMTPEDLLNLRGAAFDKAWDKMFDGNRSDLFRR